MCIRDRVCPPLGRPRRERCVVPDDVIDATELTETPLLGIEPVGVALTLEATRAVAVTLAPPDLPSVTAARRYSMHGHEHGSYRLALGGAWGDAPARWGHLTARALWSRASS